MHRTDGDQHVSNMFSEGDPGVPRLPTQIDKDWLNAVQEEIVNAIIGAGITLVKGTNNQLAAAIVNKTSNEGITGIKTFLNGLVSSATSAFSATDSGTTAATFEADDSESAHFRGHGFAGLKASGDSNLDPVIRSDGTIDFASAGNPASTVGYTNKLSKKSTVKAWGLLTNDGAGGVSVVDGFNITSTAVNGTQYQRVTLAAAMASTNYAVLATMTQKNAQTVSVIMVNACNLNTGYFDLAFFNALTGAQIAIDTGAAYHVSFMVLGAQ